MNCEDNMVMVEFSLVTSLCLWLGNKSLFVVPDNVTKQRLITKPNSMLYLPLIAEGSSLTLNTWIFMHL